MPRGTWQSTFPLRKPRSDETADMPYGDHVMDRWCGNSSVYKSQGEKEETRQQSHWRRSPSVSGVDIGLTGRPKWTWWDCPQSKRNSSWIARDVQDGKGSWSTGWEGGQKGSWVGARVGPGEDWFRIRTTGGHCGVRQSSDVIGFHVLEKRSLCL